LTWPGGAQGPTSCHARRAHLAPGHWQVRRMTEIARLELGRRRPDGSCEVAVIDAQGHRHKGVLTDPGLVDDYLDYLDSAGLDSPAVTGIGPAEPAPPARASVKPHPSNIAIPVSKLARLVATAARAPSVHNTQPWRFRAGRDTIDLLADRSRKLPRIDPAGREMLISCGAALFGLRLAICELGYLARFSCSRTQPTLTCSPGCGAALPHRSPQPNSRC
jgi:Nitroreductase family